MDGDKKLPGGLKDKMPDQNEKLGSGDFANESKLSGDGGVSSNGGPQRADKFVDKASDTSKKVKDAKDDIKSIAKASANQGVGKEDVEDIKKAAEEKGAKGVAGEVGRKAVGKGVQAGLDATGVGAPLGATAGKAVEKGLKKENLKKIAFVASIPIIITVAVISFFVFLFASFLRNPLKFGWKVLTDSTVRGYAIDVVGGVACKFTILPGACNKAKDFVNDIVIDTMYGDLHKRYGYVDYKPGTAYAQSSSANPPAGSIDEKLLKIDYGKAKYQYGNEPSCPVTVIEKTLIGPNGEKRVVVDKVLDKDGKVYEKTDPVAVYCILNKMPLFNIMVRTQQARDVNKFSSSKLNYADSKDSSNFKDKSYQEIKKYVYDKSYERVTSKPSDTPKVQIVNQYIDEVRKKLEAGEDPNTVEYDFGGRNPDSPESRLETLCTFTKGYLDEENQKKSLFSRLNTGQRNSAKFGTMDSTSTLNLTSGDENRATYDQVSNLTRSKVYNQNVYGTQIGESIDPESLSNTAYGGSFIKAQNVLSLIKDSCGTAQAQDIVADISNVFTGSRDDAINSINASYNSLRDLIAEQSKLTEGKFTSPNDFGVRELMIGVIRTGGGSSVSGVERQGYQNYGNQAQGFDSVYNQYMIRNGGRFQTDTEATELREISENTRRTIEKKSGIAYRLFNQNNIRSLANIMSAEMPKNTTEVKSRSKEYVATLSNPIKMIADFQGSVGYFAFGERSVATAQAVSGSAFTRVDSVGIAGEDFDNINFRANSNDIKDLQENGSDEDKKILGYFDKCTKSNIPTKSIFARKYETIINGSKVAVNENAPIKEEDGTPVYLFTTDGTSLGFADKKEFMACEIYLMPKDAATQRDLIGSQNDIFGQNITDLAVKYRANLYINSFLDNMVELSSTEKTEKIYANSASGGASSGDSGIDGVECPPNLGGPDPARNDYFQLPKNPDAYSSYSSSNNQYGSKELVCVVYTVGKALKAKYPGASLHIGDMNAAGHKSHFWGIAMDLVALNNGSIFAADNTKSGYNKQATVDLGKLFVDTGIIQNIWWCGTDGSIEEIRAYAESKGTPINIRCISGHNNHFHVDISCEFGGPIDVPYTGGGGAQTAPCNKAARRSLSSGPL
jgi:hypothetical protein